MTPRWCICGGLVPISTALQIDVMFHRGELWKPSSTGDLITRAFPTARRHVYDPRVGFAPETVPVPGRELWILHPAGDPVPEQVQPEALQVLLLDGSWRQSGDMIRAMEGRGHRVRLPMEGVSRYRLRTQAEPGKFSTVEALLFLLRALGLESEAAALQIQFELHVYAGLLTRGKVVEAMAYLAESPIRTACPEVVERLQGKVWKRGWQQASGRGYEEESGDAPGAVK